ncbi:hypothetical protein EDC01DRAFT_651264 [Geopyxis carbonaria]|nr:hypothetical protein EDC01DRAFT_651264 [Geopyxis carbonaria]
MGGVGMAFGSMAAFLCVLISMGIKLSCFVWVRTGWRKLRGFRMSCMFFGFWEWQWKLTCLWLEYILLNELLNIRSGRGVASQVITVNCARKSGCRKLLTLPHAMYTA